ncbi:STAS domain-containing protein [Mycobacterium hubeiense]|uniref:STAS domain-containing protein n=1 Tax=Mycobacterium hubeiense TaxID=1867256 RepID=UPI001E595441|nr:STAS domain-containing protein [Mycobacterium sp. QGD 101]
MQIDQPGILQVSKAMVDDHCVLTVRGVLDSNTYLSLRDTIIGAALSRPLAVIVDVNELSVPATSAWTVFSSARWHVSRWPDVPVALVCYRHRYRREALADSKISRHVPVHPTVESAIAQVSRTGRHRYRLHARAELMRGQPSIWRACELTAEWLRAWSKPELIPAVRSVAAVLVENAVAHAGGAVAIRLETDGSSVIVAVEDTSSAVAIRREASATRGRIGGLEVVAAVCDAWGNAPTTTGKTVWALISRTADV